MLPHKPQNKWHVGLLSVFGYMDSSMWSILWAIASKADDNGHCAITDQQIWDMVVKSRINYNNMYREMKVRGLIRVARKRVSHIPVKGQCPKEKHCRLIELYQGIQYGKLPIGSTAPIGLIPHYFMNTERKVSWQTHKLFRQKFKPVKYKPEYASYTHLTKWQLMNLVPSARYRQKLERERVAENYQRKYRQMQTFAKQRRFL